MHRSAAIAGFALLITAVSACSEQAQDKTQDAAGAIASDIEKTGDRAANAAGEVQRDVSAALSSADEKAERAGDDIESAADRAGDDISEATAAARQKTGTALENAGRAIKD